MSDGAETSANWQGVISSLVFASVVLAIVWLTFACCGGALPEFFYPRLWRAALTYDAVTRGAGTGAAESGTAPAAPPSSTWKRRLTVEPRPATAAGDAAGGTSAAR